MRFGTSALLLVVPAVVIGLVALPSFGPFSMVFIACVGVLFSLPLACGILYTGKARRAILLNHARRSGIDLDERRREA